MGYTGIITPMITPFKENGDIDYEGTTKLLDMIKEFGVSGVFPLGSTGLFPWLSVDEKKKFVSHVVENAQGLKVLAGVGSPNVRESRELSIHANDVGADAAVLMPGYYINPSQEWIVKQFEYVLSGNDASFFIYNIPQLTGTWIDLDTYGKIKDENSNVVGAKESSGDMRYFSRIVAMREDSFDVFQGQDDLLHASMSLGASGGVCGLSNFSPSISAMYDMFTGGKAEKSRSIQMEVVNPLIKAINVPQFPAGYYYAFYRASGTKGGYRTPMTALTQEEKTTIDHALDRAESLLQTYK